MNVNVNSTQQNADGSFTIKGTGISGTTVTVVSGGSQIGSVVVGNGGSFQINLPAGTPSTVTVMGGGRSQDINLLNGPVVAPTGGQG